MTRTLLPRLFFGLLALALLGTVVYPPLDIIVSGWFYKPGQGFYLESQVAFVFLHHVAVKGAWILGFAFPLCAVIAFFRGSAFCGIAAKGWLFLFLALLIGPALIANGLLKDHWGRDRPHEIVEFGGTEAFSPALIPQKNPSRNESFVSGDGAFGFYLPCFAYLVPLGTRRRLSRRVFWGLMATGCLFAFSRIAMGSHFLSDNLFATLLMITSAGALHTAMYGKKLTQDYWRQWLS
jgi:lipid A 4'-phosphatase